MTFSLHIAALHAILKARSAFRDLFVDPRRRRTDSANGSYERSYDNVGPVRHLGRVDVNCLLAHRDVICATSELYMHHKFDLLGSGWVNVRHGMECQGLEGHRYPAGDAVCPDAEGQWLTGRINGSNVDRAQSIWQLVELTDPPYQPIDWQLDFKSGYRWSETTWYRDIRYGNMEGADVKVPWELGRMQHFAQLAWAFALSKDGQKGFREPQTYLREFRNQVLDFIAANPPRFGVQWSCTMDIAIRVANWLLAWDLFRAHGAEFDDAFAQELMRSVREHAVHIWKNLEWSPYLRHNHYLAGICGLIFCAAYSPVSKEADTWLAFAVNELIAEVEGQFHADGTDFEGSVCYHRLSSEMVVYATALVIGLPADRLSSAQQRATSRQSGRGRLPPGLIACHRSWVTCSEAGTAGDTAKPFPDWYLERLGRMAEFIMHVTKPNGHVPQIGDNDNGRFVKVMPAYLSVIPSMEDHLDARHLVGAVNGLFARDDFAAFAPGASMDTAVIRSMSGGVRVPHAGTEQDETAGGTHDGNDTELRRLEAELRNSARHVCSTTLFTVASRKHAQKTLREGGRVHSYAAFGLYVFRSERLFMSVRCGPVGRKGRGGHDHNDQLSMELTIDGTDWVTDPGTYLYTPLPSRRNEYRSVAAHFAPRFDDIEPSPLGDSLFALRDRTKSKTLYLASDKFCGVHYGYPQPTYRLVRINDFEVRVNDYLPRSDPEQQNISVTVDGPVSPPVAFSPGYGILSET